MIKDWPFADAANTAAFVSRYVMQGEPICRVHHDWEDCAWQFHPDRIPELSDSMIVCLEHVFKLDRTIGELHDLPCGWTAERTARYNPWVRLKDHPFPVFKDDGFYLDDATAYKEFCEIPAAEIREGLKAGQLVKLIFRFADEWSERQDNDCERMWVDVLEVDAENVCYRGRLLNQPHLHTAIHEGDELWFHPMHVFAIDD